MNTPGLIAHQTITTIVVNVDQARADIAQAFTLLQGAKARLVAVLGDGQSSHFGHLWDRDISDYDLEAVAKKVDIFQQTNAWRYVIEQTGLRHYLTETRQRELYAQLNEGGLPPLTVANVLSTLQGLTREGPQLLQEFVQEVFDWLRPARDRSYIGGLKTNSPWKVGRKAIISHAVDQHWNGCFHLNHHRESNIRALGNALSLLDGQGVQRYPDDLVTQLGSSLKTVHAGATIFTPYVTCKPYTNGNMHLQFRRQDLIDKLNVIGSNGALPGKA